MDIKICSRCKIPKSIDCFDRNRTKKDGHQGRCKVCRSEHERQPGFKEKRVIYRHQYYLKNIEKLRKKRKEYCDTHREWKRTYDRQWQKIHKEARSIISKRHYYKKHYGLTVEEKKDMYVLQNGICFLCPNPLPKEWIKANIDHDHSNNVVRKLLCDSCNRQMSAVDNEYWLNKAIIYRNSYRKKKDDI